MKVAIVTLNPCLDRAIYLGGPLVPGDNHRALRVVENAAGKGLNQAVVLENLGTVCDYYSFSSGGEDTMSRFLASRSLRHHTAVARCGIRTNVKVIDGDGLGTEFNEAGGPVTADELDELLGMLDQFKGDILSVCGSVPSGIDKSVYREMIARGKKKGLVSVLDADGEALRLGLAGRPDVIKPNRRELAGLFGMSERELASEEDVIALARRVLDEYGTTVLCTLDENGSLCVSPEGVWRVGVAKVPLRGFSGAGDTYLAAFLYAKYEKGVDMPTALSFAARASAAKIALEGSVLPTKEQIEQIGEVLVEKIG